MDTKVNKLLSTVEQVIDGNEHREGEARRVLSAYTVQ